MVHLAFPAAFQLPVDIDDALQMLENRTLDSITWKKIRPFYSIPLNVPSGDFLVLKRIFPDILKQLPSRQILSEKYSPWHEEQITSFFKDYPHLIEFEPILEFTGNCEKKGSMNVSIANTLVENAGEVHATFNLIPAPWLTIRARTDVGDDHARWSDRSIFFQPSKSLSLQLGNIDWPDEYGLMSGRFSDNITHEDRYSNWLYGNELSWNGFCLGYTRFKNSGEHLLHSLLYGHILNSNTQYALQSGFSFGEYHGMSTYLVIDKEGNRQNNVYGGITYQFDSKKMDLNLAIGATSQNYSAFPFLAILKYSYATGHCNVSVCHYNDTSGLQNSQKLYSNLIHIADSQSFEKITSVDILNKLCFSDFPSAGIRLTSTLIDFRPVYNTIHLSIDFGKEHYYLKTFAKVNMSGTPEKYTFGGTFKFTGFQPLGITLKSNVLYMEDNFYLEQTELLLSAAPLECMKISPAFLLKQHLRDSAPEMFGELWTVVTLRKGTASQLRIKYPIQRNHFGEGLQFDCKVSFIF